MFSFLTILLFSWYRTAKKLIHSKNSSKDDLSLIQGPKEWQGYKSDLGSRIGSPLLLRDSRDINAPFSTRTRLRPGGPPSNVANSRERHLRSPMNNFNPNRSYMATMRNGSLPSVTMSEFEEIGMKTMQGFGPGNKCSNFPLQEDLYQLSSRNRLNIMGRQLQSPATPLVKMKTNTKQNAAINGDDSFNPRVQMYGTRVVYSDRDANTSAGIITSNKHHGTLSMIGNKSNFSGVSNKPSGEAV